MAEHESNASDEQYPDQAAPAEATFAAGPSAGVQAMHGHLHKEAKSFWADAWSRVLVRPGAVLGLTWIGIVAFFAIFAPIIASGHPLVLWTLDESGARESWSSPLFEHLTAIDVLLLIGGVIGPIWILLPRRFPIVDRVFQAITFGAGAAAGITVLAVAAPWFLEDVTWRPMLAAGAVGSVVLAVVLGTALRGAETRSERAYWLIALVVQAGLIAFGAEMVANYVSDMAVADWIRRFEQRDDFEVLTSLSIAGVVTLVSLTLPIGRSVMQRVAMFVPAGLLTAAVVTNWWMPPLETFEYRQLVRDGEAEAVYTIVPLSPNQRQMELDLLEPGADATDSPRFLGDPNADYPVFQLGTDGQGQDVLSQILHACRLSISIGFVATGIATFIGVTMGSLMGYFGGWVDMLLYRIVEVFMSIPLLFLLIVAAAVLPRNIYVMMVVIGCVTWTNSARYIRAEFYRLRDQDFVQAARALGLPLRYVLFRHMLPNGVTPVLVEVSFAIAVAILFETILSFLGLGPTDQSSWGLLLSMAFSDIGEFIWWLAMFPGFAIFLTVLSLTLVGEALRDAIDPKLRKAAH